MKIWIKCWKTQIVAVKRARKICLKALHMAWYVEIKLTIKQANSKKSKPKKPPQNSWKGGGDHTYIKSCEEKIQLYMYKYISVISDYLLVWGFFGLLFLFLDYW